ncbi:MAG TPA: hypothetical protein VLH15_04390 [Dehalococcoidales bacterium]|nr:hypothetical protein [Dehalococcoidales bacterium]
MNNELNSFWSANGGVINNTPVPDLSSGGGGCTQALITGLTSFQGNMTGQCVDGSAGQWPGFLKLVTPDSGNRYLTVGGFGEEVFPLMNEKGVALTQGLRLTRPFPPPPPGDFVPAGSMMRRCDSAPEYVKMWAENYMKQGAPWGGRCNLVIDPKVGYCMEGANFIYNDPSNHVIHGPMCDQVFASANFYISKRLKAAAEAGIGAGYNRARRLWQLLIDRQYDSPTMQPRSGGITLAYFMHCLRDHGNIKPEESRLSPYISEDRGDSALCCHGSWQYTSNAFINVSRPDHTDLFSCTWITPGQPCIAPFLPVFIGINILPKALGTTEAFQLFEKLRAAIEYHPKHRDDITLYWSAFEIQAIEESSILEKQASALADKGNTAEARGLLTAFVQNKCDQAMAAAENILKSVNDLPVLGSSS